MWPRSSENGQHRATSFLCDEKWRRMSQIDQSYASLGKAIEAFARLEDRRRRDAAVKKYLNLVRHELAPEPTEQEVADWRKANPLELEEIWRSQRQFRFNEARRERAAEASAELTRAQGDQFSRGLLEALRSGDAIAWGRLGGLQYAKTRIEGRVWNGDWTFDASANRAVGGVPCVLIDDISVSRVEMSSHEICKGTEISRTPIARLTSTQERQLMTFLKNQGPLSEAKAIDLAEKHMGRQISRTQFRQVRNSVGDAYKGGKGGRARKTLETLPDDVVGEVIQEKKLKSNI
ncbi:hypothetical protein AMST5_00647 [freshwater sediment metagenome]|uniref:Uncharacterized protein n=1 Tax=freshwater sediment metagenome TaxID=556182 RepID=A0AA48LY38_9ZZZZ